MATVKEDDGGKFYFIADCGKTEGGFDSEGAAKIALRLHVIGCKKC